jgi:hypothetical protein
MPSASSIFLYLYDYEEDLALYLNNLESLRMIGTKFDWNWPAGSREEVFFFNINTSEYQVFPIVAPPKPRGPWFEETWIYMYIISESFYVNMTYSGSVILEKIFKWPYLIFEFL